MSLIGMPIYDSDAERIGTITSIDVKEDIWYGQLEEKAYPVGILDKNLYSEELKH